MNLCKKGTKLLGIELSNMFARYSVLRKFDVHATCTTFGVEKENYSRLAAGRLKIH